MSVAKKLASLISEGSQSKTSPYDTTGTVKRIEGKTAYVVFDGGDIETPVDLSIACEKGDTVVVRVSGNKARLTGNLTAPPTDDKKARQAEKIASKAYKAAQSVVERADAGEFDGQDGQDGEDGEDGSSVYEVRAEYCLSTSNSTFIPYQSMSWSETLPTYVSGCYYWTRTVIYYDDEDETIVYGDPVFSLSEQLTAETKAALDSTNNHFWHDNSGAYVTEADGSYATGYATRITSSGILQSYNNKLMSSWTNSGVSFYKSDGETALASFGTGGISFASDIPFTIGNNSSFIKWVYESGSWKIKICADSIEMGGQDVMVDGDAGKWYSGTGITGTSVNPTIFPNSGISDAKVGDMYLNTSTSNTYRCTTGGAASTARWVFASNIKGADGEDGQDGADGIDVTSQYMRFYSTTPPSSSPGKAGLNIFSGYASSASYNTNYININSNGMAIYVSNDKAAEFNASSVSFNGFTMSRAYNSYDQDYRSQIYSSDTLYIQTSEILHLHGSDIHIGDIVTGGDYFDSTVINPDYSTSDHYGIKLYGQTGDGRAATVAYVKSKHPSDIRLKENVQPIEKDKDPYIDLYDSLEPIKFTFKPGVMEDVEEIRTIYGFSAQAVESFATEYGIGDCGLVFELETYEGTAKRELAGPTFKNLDYESMHALHVLYAHDLEKRISSLEQRIAKLTA